MISDNVSAICWCLFSFFFYSPEVSFRSVWKIKRETALKITDEEQRDHCHSQHIMLNNFTSLIWQKSQEKGYSRRVPVLCCPVLIRVTLHCSQLLIVFMQNYLPDGHVFKCVCIFKITSGKNTCTNNTIQNCRHIASLELIWEINSPHCKKKTMLFYGCYFTNISLNLSKMHVFCTFPGIACKSTVIVWFSGNWLHVLFAHSSLEE